jgi:hypothetical protein
MEIVNAASSRADWYDRNAAANSISYSANDVDPHGTTVRDSYTVPANRKALISVLDSQMDKSLVGGLIRVTSISLRYVPSIIPATSITNLTMLTNNLYDFRQLYLYIGLVIYPGDTIQIRTSDSSGGGKVNYNIFCSYTEFDF